MLKSKEHVEQRRFSYHSFRRSDASSPSNREPFLPPVPADLSGRTHSPLPNYINPAQDNVAEVVPEKRAAGFFDESTSSRDGTLSLLNADAAGASVGKLFAALQGFLREQVAPIRLASHFAVLVVATIVLLVSRMNLPELDILRTLPADGLLAERAAADANLINPNPIEQVGAALQVAVRPFTVTNAGKSAAASSDIQSAEADSPAQVASARVDRIQVYEVRSGDNLQIISARYGLRPETIQWANPEVESNPDLLRIGDELIIPPVDGVLHVVRPGDTLSSLAAKYKAEISDIVAHPMNKLESADTPISRGKQLIIPHGAKPYVPRQVAMYRGPVPATAARGSGHFDWPVSGHITQRFWHGHRAIDIGAWTGAPIVAADSGYVIKASRGWNGGYGTMVMIDHGNGFVSLYAHMDTTYVRQGESVAKGQKLGTVGNTGRSTGPHLHFEIRQQGAARNPIYHLP